MCIRDRYQSWTAGSNYNNEFCKPDSRALHKNIRRVIQRIAVVEQHHFTIIGQLITLLGGQPECRSAEPCSYWRGNMVDYSCDIRTVLATDAESEKFAAQAYADQSQKIKDPQVSKMLARLSLDEDVYKRQIYARSTPAKLAVGSTTPSLRRRTPDADIRHYYSVIYAKQY